MNAENYPDLEDCSTSLSITTTLCFHSLLLGTLLEMALPTTP